VSSLVVGSSGGGKSTVVAGLVERLRAANYNFCIIDPEGDYDTVEGAVVLGSPERAPSLDECMQLLCKLNENAVINLLGIKLADRPAFFMTLFARIRELRASTGSPHWLIVDEAHHVLPADWQATDVSLPQRLDGTLLVSITPSSIASKVLGLMDSLIVLGDKPREMSQEFAAAKQVPPPTVDIDKVPEGSALLWRLSQQESPQLITVEPTKTERRRHLRKYAEGSLGEDRSFYFKGKEGKLNLRAHNLIVFTDLADGVDEDTWLHHWRRQEISRWMRECIKDETLAGKVAKLERERPDDATESRRRVRELIEESYTLPAESAVARTASGSRT